ncbi:hypothetical protein [Herpetosiphon llansteffanensis]|uniref:hypothetical protein n=1 Tax=Herpetosiphon llansteffanensis TaxID=2094568 RepID=UPI000D7BE3DB|nr:hypothetical protein [Herpetosiphon llansteffanensis]
MKAQSTAIRQLIIAFVLFPILLMTVILIVPNLPESPWRAALAIVPLVPVGLGIQAMYRAISSMDEFQRHVQLLAFAFAVGATGFISCAYGLLQVLVNVPQISWLWVLPLLTTCWSFGLAFANRSYQ